MVSIKFRSIILQVMFAEITSFQTDERCVITLAATIYTLMEMSPRCIRMPLHRRYIYYKITHKLFIRKKSEKTKI